MLKLDTGTPRSATWTQEQSGERKSKSKAAVQGGSSEMHMPCWSRQTRALVEEAPVKGHKDAPGRTLRSQCRSDLVNERKKEGKLGGWILGWWGARSTCQSPIFQEWPCLSVPAVVSPCTGAGSGECGLCVNVMMKFREWPLGLLLKYAPCQQRSWGQGELTVRPLCFLLWSLLRGYLVGEWSFQGSGVWSSQRRMKGETEIPEDIHILLCRISSLGWMEKVSVLYCWSSF